MRIWMHILLDHKRSVDCPLVCLDKSELGLPKFLSSACVGRLLNK